MLFHNNQLPFAAKSPGGSHLCPHLDFVSPELDSDFLAVLSDYPSPDISPPIFRRGEKLRVISE